MELDTGHLTDFTVLQGLNLQITNAVLARLTIFRYDVTSKATSIKPSTTHARATAEKYRDLWPAVRQALALAAAVCKSSPWILRILAWFLCLAAIYSRPACLSMTV